MSDINYPTNENQLTPEILSIHALNRFTPYNAPARGVMFSSHFSQRPVINGSEPNLIQTGVEDEFGKYTFNIKMPEDGTIVKVIQRYYSGRDENAINFNPETLVIYRSDKTGQYDYFTIPYHANYGSVFGFKYNQKPAIRRLTTNASFQKDEIFADSPAVKGDSNYTYGANLNVIVMSHPNVGLDGYVINRNALKKFGFKVYETRTVEFGSNTFPLNINGTPGGPYLAFPEIGSYTREDGLLMALRKIDPIMSPANMSIYDVCEVDYRFDQRVYLRPGRGRVVDLTVTKSDNVNRQLPEQMTKQLTKYNEANQRYHRTIVETFLTLEHEHRRLRKIAKLKISPKLQRLIVEAMANINHDAARHKQSLSLVYRKEPLDGWRMTFVVEYDIVPDRGFKFTCTNGGKGVVCRVEEPENMPVDEDGNVADLITGPDSVPGRMNLGRLYQPYFNGAARDVFRSALEAMGLPRRFVPNPAWEMSNLEALGPKRIQAAMALILKYYQIVSPETCQFLQDEEEQKEFLLNAINEGVMYNFFPITSQVQYDQAVIEIEKNFKLTYGPVSYVDKSGRRVVTKENFRISPNYMMLLDKIADAWLSVCIGKLSNFGTLAPMNHVDKHASPWHKTPPKTIGETEARTYADYCGPEMIAELMDRSGSIRSQRSVSRSILKAEKPTAIEEVVNRNFVPLGNSRQLQMFNHMSMCAGFELVYRPEELE